MSALLALAMQAAIDWGSLPELSYRMPPPITARMNDFVEREVKAGRCVAPAAKGPPTLVVEVAVLVETDGTVRATVPRAIQCPNVEQYAAGLVTAFARNNLLPRGAQTEQWYRASLTFSWKP